MKIREDLEVKNTEDVEVKFREHVDLEDHRETCGGEEQRERVEVKNREHVEVMCYLHLTLCGWFRIFLQVLTGVSLTKSSRLEDLPPHVTMCHVGFHNKAESMRALSIKI